MAKNRKNHASGFKLGPPLKAALLCVLIGGSGVGYVWQKAVIDQLGQEIKKREIRVRALQDQNERYSNQLDAMQSVPVLEMRIRDLNLGLVMPQPSQIMVLTETPRPSTASPAPTEPVGREGSKQYASFGETRSQ